ncbi:MAG: polyphosphate polymerase domain-containing protein [Lachnospiraceae bacterium]|nr:polyphosphate polymerase domain-containing protein [Lachnospiraceae bacterium]
MESKVFDPSLAENRYRHEFKYLCSYAQLKMLEARLRGLVPLDPHVGEDGIYNIRSLYFDDYYDRYLKENEAGTDPREKFRIRIYNHSSEKISLELKKKVRGKTQKLSCRLTEEQCRTLMAGEIPDLDKDAPALLQKLCLLMRTNLLRPKVIVEYDRVPYVYPQGNVRITLDENIRSSSRVDLFLEDQIPLRPILMAGQHVLEVKYDEYIPDFIYRTVQIENLRQTAFSKYYLCRKYNL